MKQNAPKWVTQGTKSSDPQDGYNMLWFQPIPISNSSQFQPIQNHSNWFKLFLFLHIYTYFSHISTYLHLFRPIFTYFYLFSRWFKMSKVPSIKIRNSIATQMWGTLRWNQKRYPSGVIYVQYRYKQAMYLKYLKLGTLKV